MFIVNTRITIDDRLTCSTLPCSIQGLEGVVISVTETILHWLVSFISSTTS